MNHLDIKGWVKIVDLTDNIVLVDKSNQIHYENFSEALALSISSGPKNAANATGFINTMTFGNGGTTVSPTGVITYNTPNYIGASSTLYNQTYVKYINQYYDANLDTTKNYINTSHVNGKAYTDLVIQCILDYGEPADQQAFDNSTDLDDTYVFDELGLKSYGGKLLTHVIFHPVQKSLNRMFQIDYTIRIQSLTSLTA